MVKQEWGRYREGEELRRNWENRVGESAKLMEEETVEHSFVVSEDCHIASKERKCGNGWELELCMDI